MNLDKAELQTVQDLIFLSKIIENNLSENSFDSDFILQQLHSLQPQTDALLARLAQGLSGSRQKKQDAEFLETLFPQYEAGTITMGEILAQTKLKKRSVYNHLRNFRQNLLSDS